MASESETVRALCPCGAMVDWDECPYPAGRDGLLYKIVCHDPECGWTMVSSTPEGAIAAWDRRTPSAGAKDDPHDTATCEGPKCGRMRYGDMWVCAWVRDGGCVRQSAAIAQQPKEDGRGPAR